MIYKKSIEKDIALEDMQRESLSVRNVYNGENDQCVRSLIVLLKNRNPDIYQWWFQNLLDQEGYIIQKKKYYAALFNRVIDGVGNAAVYFYGAGKMAKYILRILSDLGVTQRITSIIVTSQSGNPSKMYGLQIKQLMDLNKNERFGLIFGVNPVNKAEIEEELADYDYQCIELNLDIIGRYYNIG